AGPSGPGDKSTRTDQLKIGSAFYADDTAAISTAAPKSKTRGSADNVGGRPSNPILSKPLTPLFAPTEQPDLPSTYGVDTGDGAGSEILIMQQPDDMNFKAAIASYMPVLAYISDQPNTSPETKKAIRQLRDNL
ncbi:hypothetical protein EB001_12655, partial [bacterium]|nr:hypothetical protein [bacterium]